MNPPILVVSFLLLFCIQPEESAVLQDLGGVWSVSDVNGGSLVTCCTFKCFIYFYYRICEFARNGSWRYLQ